QWKRVNVEVNMLDKKDFLKEIRASWADICNQYLEEDKKIDHRSFAERGIELIPTIHEGYAAREIEARGGISEICSANRRIKKANEELKKLISGVTEIKNNIHEIVNDWVRELEERSRELDEKVRGRISKARRRTEQERAALERAREAERGTVGREQVAKEWLDGLRERVGSFGEEVNRIRKETNGRLAKLRVEVKQLGEKFHKVKIQETEKLEARVDRVIGVIKSKDVDFGEALNMYRDGNSEALKSYENAIVKAFMNLEKANTNERAERVSELEEAAEKMILEVQNRDDEEWEW
nr:MobA/MobL family protein [Lachnospiraceae bacterium]